MRSRFLTLLAAGVLCAGTAAEAQTFPPAHGWTNLERGGQFLTDPAFDIANGQRHRDCVGDSTHDAAAVGSDGTWLYMRVRVDTDPIMPGGTWDNHGWACQIDILKPGDSPSSATDPTNTDTYEWMTLI